MNIETIQKQLDMYYANNQLEEGYQYLLSNLQQAMEQNDDSLVIGLLSEILGYLRVNGKFEEGQVVADKAASLVSSLGLENSLAGATTYLNIATFYSISGQYDKAHSFYMLTTKVYEKELASNDQRLASLYNNISIFYQQNKDFQKSYQYQQKAISIISTLPDCEIELATSYANMAEISYSLKQYNIGLEHVKKAILLFEKCNTNDPHYCAALATLGNGLYHSKQFTASLQAYDKALQSIEKIYGKTKNYEIVKQNKEQVELAYEKYKTSGLYISKQYYQEVAKKALQDTFPALYKRMAIGLVGMGSECFGYDDVLSKDHDFGPGFCIWLTKEDYEQYGIQVQQVYDQLPKEYNGYIRNTSTHGNDRVGVFSISQFYYQFVGPKPKNIVSWLTIPSHALATITNGEVFHDSLGQFSQLRNFYAAFYPEDVRIKKIVASIAKMAQAGQYNYARCMQRKEYVASTLAINEFIEATLSCIYLLNKTYMPFYKWSHHGMKDLPILSDVHELLTKLVVLPMQKDFWHKDISYYQKHINEDDQKVNIMEHICAKVVRELQNQNLTTIDDSFLESHTTNLMKKIQDPVIAKTHIMEGYL